MPFPAQKQNRYHKQYFIIVTIVYLRTGFKTELSLPFSILNVFKQCSFNIEHSLFWVDLETAEGWVI